MSISLAQSTHALKADYAPHEITQRVSMRCTRAATHMYVGLPYTCVYRWFYIHVPSPDGPVSCSIAHTNKMLRASQSEACSTCICMCTLYYRCHQVCTCFLVMFPGVGRESMYNWPWFIDSGGAPSNRSGEHQYISISCVRKACQYEGLTSAGHVHTVQASSYPCSCSIRKVNLMGT